MVDGRDRDPSPGIGPAQLRLPELVCCMARERPVGVRRDNARVPEGECVWLRDGCAGYLAYPFV